jgi:Heparinase II/III-like protein/Heparinase II/III N-terminus
MGLLTKARTAWGLGPANIARAVGYRLGVQLGINSVRKLKANTPRGPFFRLEQGAEDGTSPVVIGWQSEALLFSLWPLDLSHEPPDWLANPFNGQQVASPGRDWWQISDFDPAVGDIKLVWELSRMDWVLAFAQRAHKGDKASLDRLNAWLADWCENNPPYKGPNWKCGQEASIRVMHLAMAALILGQLRTTELGLYELIRLHLQRIEPTVQYAIAQDNNHGTSEAAALFMGGSWLAAMGSAEGVRWEHTGRRLLEERAARLIGSQGSFSQYSLNYHRVMLDTLCMAEVLRRNLELPAFSERFQSRALAASEWLRFMVNHTNGDGPNVGANDGARLLQLTSTPFRDYRPSVALAMALFAEQRAYEQTGAWEHALTWLGLAVPQAVAAMPQSYVADDGGFAILRSGDAMVMMRYSRFRFRPSQADALHLDLWLGANNLLRDAGTYSYNTDPKWANYFSGTASHNTVQFDDRDQMPRLSRFLFGDWLKADGVQPLPGSAETKQFAAGYRDRCGARHYRAVSLHAGRLQVVDKVQGFARKAVMRWRLPPGDWRLESTNGRLCLVQAPEGAVTVCVSSSIPVLRCELVQGWESRHYLEKTPVPVLEVEVQQAGTLTTEVLWTL